MRLLVLCFSARSNNRLLAKHLAERLGADIAEVRDARWFPKLRMIRDLSKDRRPPITPIAQKADDYDHILVIAPLFDSNVAHPMKTALSTWGRAMPAYSFVTFCGYHRQEQRDKVHTQLVDLTGKEPEHILELCVGDLVPEKDRRKVWVVSNYRVKHPELARFSEKLDEIANWFRG